MITALTQRQENGKRIKTWKVDSNISDQNVLQCITEIIGDMYVEFVRVIPMFLNANMLDCFVFQFPDDSTLNVLPIFHDTTIFPHLPDTGFDLQIHHNYSFVPLMIPIYKTYNGIFKINFESQNGNIEPNKGTGYIVEIVTRNGERTP
jgi:hypothetical protein